MSRSYDDRIVRMGFDNAQFEAGTKQTMTTLDKLNEKLKLPGASEGSKNVQTAVSSVDFSSMEKAILNIEKRFSTLGVVSMNVIGKITDGITGSVAKLEAATLGQIKTGGWNRAMNIANAKFQIEGLGFAWEEVEKAVSYGVKDTAYGLDAAASAASQLAASGVDFKKVLDTVNGQELTAMHKSLRAISGVAAMTNSSYEDISRIFTTVAGNGRLMGDQLLQLSSRGMNAAAKLAEVMNTTEEDIRDMVSRGKIDFETFAFAMDDAFGNHAKEANKTFTGALGNMKAALSRVGEIFSDPIINKTNTLFISLTSRIDEFKNKLKSIKVPHSLEEIKKMYDGSALSATAYEQIMKGVGKKTISLGEDFAKMWQSGIDAFSAMIKSVDFGWFDKLVEKVDGTINKVKEFFDFVKDLYSDSAEEAANGIEDATKTLLVSAEEAQAAKDIILKGMYGSGQKRVDALTEMFGGGDIGAQHAKNVQAYVDSVVAAGWDFDKASIKVEDASERIAKSQTNIANEVKKARIRNIIDNVKKTFSNLWEATKNVAKAAKKVTGAIVDAFAAVFKIDLNKISSGISGFSGLLVTLSKKLIVSDKTAKKITDTFTVIFTKIKEGIDYIQESTTKVKEFFDAVKKDGLIKTVQDTISGVFDGITEAFVGDDDSSVFSKIKEKFSGITEMFSEIFSSGDKAGKLSKTTEDIKGLVDSIKSPGGLEESFKKLSTFKLPEFDTSKITDFINGIIDSVKRLSVKDVINISLGYQAVSSLIGLVTNINKVSKISSNVAGVPLSISKFFTSVSTSFKNLSKAKIKDMSRQSMPKAILALAGSLAIVAASILTLSFIKPEKIATATGVCVLMMILLTKMVTTLTKEGATLSIVVGGVKNLVPLIVSISIMLAVISTAMIKIAIAAKLIEKVPPENIASMALVLGAFIGGITVLLKNMNGLSAKSVLASAVAMTLIMSAMSAMFVSVGLAVLAIRNVDNVEKILLSLFAFISVITLLVYAFLKDTKDFGYSITSKAKALSSAVGSLAVAVLLIAVSVRMLKDVKNVEQLVVALVASLVIMMAAVWFFSERLADQKDYNLKSKMTALTSSVLILSVSMNLIARALKTASEISYLEETALTMVASLAAVVIMVGLFVKATDKYDSSIKSRISAFTGGVLALTVSMNLIAIAFRSASKTKNLETTALTMVATLGAIALIVGAFLKCTDSYDSSIEYRIGMLSVAFVAIGAAMLMIAASVRLIGNIDHIVSSGLIMIGAVLMIGEMLIMFNTMTKDDEASTVAKKTLSLAVAFIAVSAAMLIIASALKKLDKLQNLEASAIALGALFAVIMIALGAFTYAAGKTEGASGSVIAVAGAFLIIAVALAVLANSIEKLSGMENGLLSVALTFGIFVGSIVLLAALATAFPAFEKGLSAVGKAFLYAGAGAALVGVGIFLVCEGIKVLSPAIGLLAINMEAFFLVLENHQAAAIAVGVVTLVLIAGIIIAIMKLSPVIEAIANTISAVAKKVGGTLDKGKSKLKNWISTLSTKGKATIVALIATLCAAILKASPTILDTVGQLLIKLLAFLGSIAGSVAYGLLDFLVKLLNGLADAISSHAARIAAAIWGIVIALIDVFLNIIAQLLYALISPISKGFAEEVANTARKQSEGLKEYAQEQRRMAEEADAAWEDYAKTIEKASGASEEAAKKNESVVASIFGTISREAHNAGEEVDDLNEKYSDIPQNMGDYMAAINNAKYPTPDYSETELATMPWDNPQFDTIPDAKEYMNANGWSNDEVEDVAEEKFNVYNDTAAETLDDPNEYNTAMTNNMDGVQDAIKDSEKPTVEAVKTHINEPAKQALKEGRRGMYEGAEYCVEGMIEYIKTDGKKKYRSEMTALMLAGQGAAEKTNAISSPSKVYYQYGEYIVEGLINGISQNTDGAVNSMSTLSQAVFAAFGNPLDYLARIVNGDLQYDPSIRPVFDGSGLYKGASSINSMLGAQTISVAGLTGKLATDIGTLDHSNQDIINELRALREDVTLLGDDLAEMQVVMDSGALVGSIAAPMDKALGARSIRSRRG